MELDMYNTYVSYAFMLDGEFSHGGVELLSDILNVNKYALNLKTMASQPGRVILRLDEFYRERPKTEPRGKYRKTKYITTKERGVKFKSIKEAAAAYGVSETSIRNALTGKSATCKGHHFYRLVR